MDIRWLLFAALLLLGISAKEEVAKKDDDDLLFYPEEVFNSLLYEILQVGGTLTFPKYKGLGLNIEPHPMLGPEKDPEYKKNKFGTGNGDELNFDSLLVLTEENFEHLTQAATGMTTGHWMVLFGAEWCEPCTAMMQQWNRTARELKGEVNVAFIDAGASPFTSARFNVTAYPTVVLLKRGRYWTYDIVNKPRKWKEFTMFARLVGESDSDDKGTLIPFAHDSYEQHWIDLYEYLQRLYAFMQQRPGVGICMIIVGALLGVLPLLYVLSAPIETGFPGVIKRGDYQGPLAWEDKGEESDKKDDGPSAAAVDEASPQQQQGLTEPQKRKSNNKRV